VIASIPAVIRLRAIDTVVSLPGYGLVDRDVKLVVLSKFRGPRRKLMWGRIQRAITVGALEEVHTNATFPTSESAFTHASPSPVEASDIEDVATTTEQVPSAEIVDDDTEEIVVLDDKKPQDLKPAKSSLF